MQGFEEIRIRRKVLARPEVPSRGVSCRRMSKSIQRLKPDPNVLSDPDLEVSR
jgi:hypothetical protein